MPPLKSQVHIKEKDSFAYIEIVGSITENTNLKHIKTKQPIIIINTSKINHINTFGIREWIEWINQFTGDVFLIKCSPLIIMQTNLMLEFLGSATILSFYMPFACPTCSNCEKLLITIQQAEARKYTIPKCPKCQTRMDYEIHEDYYLLFLDSTPVAPTPEILKAIENLSD